VIFIRPGVISPRSMTVPLLEAGSALCSKILPPQNVKNYPCVGRKTEIPGFWRIRPCTLVRRFQFFGEARSVYPQNSPRGVQQALPKRRSIYNNLHGVTHQKTGRFFSNDVSIPSLAEKINF
jgi:hypothetical protein